MKTRHLNFTTGFAPFALAASVVLLAACDLREKSEQPQATPATATVASTADTDARRIGSLVALHQEELALSIVAVQKSTHKDVLALARMMESVHGQTIADLTTLAEKQTLTLPLTLSKTAEQSKTDLSQLTGKEFDVAYCQMMVEGHGRIIAQTEGAAENAKDADFRSWAFVNAPIMRQHLQETLACQKKCAAV